MTVCHQPTDFIVDDRGVLRLNILSKSQPTQWPYDCPIEDHNGFGRDDDCLWAQPPPRVFVTAITVDLPLNVSVDTTSQTVNHVADLTFSNVDPCRDASATIVVTTRSTIEPILDDGEFVRWVTRHRVFDDVDVPDTTFRQTWRDVAFGATTRLMGRTMTWNMTGIGPGVSRNVRVDLQAQMISGSTGTGFLWTRAQTWVTAIVVIP